MASFAVIIPAAGKGERFGGREKKTFAKLAGKPLFLQTIQLFINREDVCQTLLAVAPEDMNDMKTRYAANLGFMGVKLVEGGARRCETVARALDDVTNKADFVAIHDAARPCTAESTIDAVFAAAKKYGAAIPATPVTSTLKRVNKSDLIEETVSREGLYLAQTPQVFRRDWLIEAYQKLDELDEDITDDAQLVVRAGHPVFIVRSDATNIKITTKGDVMLAQAILKSRPAKAVSKLSPFEEAQW